MLGEAEKSTRRAGVSLELGSEGLLLAGWGSSELPAIETPARLITASTPSSA